MNQENKKGPQQNQESEETPIYLTGDSTLQTADEDRRDKSHGSEKEEHMDVSNDDLHETPADHTAGSDRAGTSERKP